MVATGCKINFFKPGWATHLDFKFFVGRFQNGVPPFGTTIIAKVRFNNDPGLETAVFDSFALGTNIFVVTNFDISSLAEGYYDAEIFAGTQETPGPANGWMHRLPAGGPITNVEGGGNLIASDQATLSGFNFTNGSYGTEAISDADLTADKGHTSTVGGKWFTRDEQVRLQPANFHFTEVTTASITFVQIGPDPLFQIYVPDSATTLVIRGEYKVSGGVGTEKPSFFFQSDPQSESNFTGISAANSNVWTTFTCRVNLSRWRGRVVNIQLIGKVDDAGNTVHIRSLEPFWSNWEGIKIPGNDEINVPWHAWPAEARTQGAFMHAAWFRRMKTRDRGLHERQYLQRPLDVTLSSGVGQYIRLQDPNCSETGCSPLEIYVPHGLQKIYMFVEHVSGNLASIKLDTILDTFTDDPVGGVILQPPGKYEVFYTVDPSDYGTIITPFLQVVVGGPSNSRFRCQDFERSRARMT
jgi:hypothetical protein